MKINNIRHKPASIAKTRWLAYATAGAATALAGSNFADAAIHYSGDLHEPFGPHKGKAKTFPLDQPGDSFRLVRTSDGFAYFDVFGIVSDNFRGNDPFSIYVYDASRLSKGSNISNCCFPYSGSRNRAILVGAPSYNRSHWQDPGIGFVGFRFNNGAGVQYGWVRVRMSKLPQNAFTVLDYAYADPGEPISAGQRSSDECVPDQASLAWLATGAAGLLGWRKSRSRTVRLKDA